MPEFFLTETNRPIPAVDTKTMIEVDRVAMEETGPNLFQMMENAGRNLAVLAMRLSGVSPEAMRVLVLAGSGGNGGGCICAARHLRNRGVDVGLCLANPNSLGEVPAAQLSIFRSAGGREIPAEELIANPSHGDAARGEHLILDGLIGYSLRGAPRGVAADLIRLANDAPAPVLSLDVPSGTDATGSALKTDKGEAGKGDFIRAKATLTLALPKTGLRRASAGDLYLGDIGIPMEAYRRSGVPDFESPFGAEFIVGLAW